MDSEHKFRRIFSGVLFSSEAFENGKNIELSNSLSRYDHIILEIFNSGQEYLDDRSTFTT